MKHFFFHKGSERLKKVLKRKEKKERKKVAPFGV
jgi:hypothetical protein